jgi:Holliday junction DNA helicase RuvA
MIHSIEGTVTQILNDSIVINVQGIGFRVYVPNQLRNQVEIHKTIGLHTHFVVKEDSLTLYGFNSVEERDMYVLLLSANGVGPRTALAIISTLSLENISKAVIQEQPELFSSVTGVGKKTAQSIILQLHGKVSSKGDEFVHQISNLDADVISALTGLGYSIIESQSALQMIPKDTPQDLETRLRLALKYFSK